MEDLDSLFNEYMEEFKKQDINAKREELINSLKEMIAIIDAKAQMDEISLHYLKSREVLDLNNPPVSEDDYLEAMLVYIETVKTMIGEYFEKRNL